MHSVIWKVAHGVLNAARNTAGNLQLRGQSYSALRSDENMKVVVTISSGQFLSVPVEEVVDNVMYSFKIVFVNRDIDKNEWQKMSRRESQNGLSIDLFCLELVEIAIKNNNRRRFEKVRTAGVGPGERQRIQLVEK